MSFSKLESKDFEIFKKWLKSHLAFGAVTVIFNKKDGTERKMLCTTNKDLTPKMQVKEHTETAKIRKVNEDALTVFDLEAKAWKSFRWDSIKQIRIDL
jgi:hypothetical protein